MIITDYFQADFPTTIGVHTEEEGQADMGAEQETNSGRSYYIDTTALHVPRAGVELISPLKNGMSTTHCNRLTTSIKSKKYFLHVSILFPASWGLERFSSHNRPHLQQTHQIWARFTPCSDVRSSRKYISTRPVMALAMPKSWVRVPVNAWTDKM